MKIPRSALFVFALSCFLIVLYLSSSDSSTTYFLQNTFSSEESSSSKQQNDQLSNNNNNNFEKKERKRKSSVITCSNLIFEESNDDKNNNKKKIESPCIFDESSVSAFSISPSSIETIMKSILSSKRNKNKNKKNKKSSSSSNNNNNDDDEGENFSSQTTITLLFEKITILDLVRIYRNASTEILLDEVYHPLVCMLGLLHTTACHAQSESLLDCTSRLGGVKVVENILPEKCLQSGGFWNKIIQKFLSEKFSSNSGNVYEFSSKEEEKEKQSSGGKNKKNKKRIPRGVIPESTIQKHQNEKRRYVPPSQRTYATLGSPLYCPALKTRSWFSRLLFPFFLFSTSGTVSVEKEKENIKNNNNKDLVYPLHPIGFAIPEANIVDKVPTTKFFDFMPMTPGRHLGGRKYKTSIKEEGLYRELFASSYFGFSNNRGGYDCGRHGDCLASGTVLFFSEVDLIPRHTMTQYPLEMLKEALELPGVEHVGRIRKSRKDISRSHPFYARMHAFKFRSHIHFKKAGTINVDKFDGRKYLNLAERMLNFTKNHLTCAAMVAAMLKRMNCENAKNVLLITRYGYDYLHLTIENGFAELGIKMTIVGYDTSDYLYRLQPVVSSNSNNQNVKERRKVFYSLTGEENQNNNNEFVSLDDISEVERGKLLSSLPKVYGGGFTFLARTFNVDSSSSSNENSSSSFNKHSATTTNTNKRKEITTKYIFDRELPEIQSQILNGDYDAVIYTYIHPGMISDAPYLETVKKLTKQQKQKQKTSSSSEKEDEKDKKEVKIAFLDHDDSNFRVTDQYEALSKIGNIFIRELDEHHSCGTTAPIWIWYKLPWCFLSWLLMLVLFILWTPEKQ